MVMFDEQLPLKAPAEARHEKKIQMRGDIERPLRSVMHSVALLRCDATSALCAIAAVMAALLIWKNASVASPARRGCRCA